ncbi:hypothetical protein EVAR_83657_1 [Eumeta japonica]|uniref:Uncharacterized protein n=1 Tax=Eumeta variegata TaxID=151549 RepID=A0A4C1UPX9_EUMVA|nr:hypothetical protein EVAR_83657_1 [Eumeta japonica]
MTRNNSAVTRTPAGAALLRAWAARPHLLYIQWRVGRARAARAARGAGRPRADAPPACACGVESRPTTRSFTRGAALSGLLKRLVYN